MKSTKHRQHRTDVNHTHDRDSLFTGREKTCPVCGTQFMCHVETWVYKLTKYQKTKWYCRYTCWRKAAKEMEK